MESSNNSNRLEGRLKWKTHNRKFKNGNAALLFDTFQNSFLFTILNFYKIKSFSKR
jgi:hypothetical protein